MYIIKHYYKYNFQGVLGVYGLNRKGKYIALPEITPYLLYKALHQVVYPKMLPHNKQKVVHVLYTKVVHQTQFYSAQLLYIAGLVILHHNDTVILTPVLHKDLLWSFTLLHQLFEENMKNIALSWVTNFKAEELFDFITERISMDQLKLIYLSWQIF